ncbi:MAG: DUF4372 domain-containing protein [Sphaerospermopsis kisseleviana]
MAFLYCRRLWRESLRDIEECLNAKGPAALYHLGLREPVAPVNLGPLLLRRCSGAP